MDADADFSRSAASKEGSSLVLARSHRARRVDPTRPTVREALLTVPAPAPAPPPQPTTSPHAPGGPHAPVSRPLPFGGRPPVPGDAPRSGPASLPLPRAALLPGRTVTELVDEGFSALRRHPGLLMGSAALLLTPVTAVVALLGNGGPTPGLITGGSALAGVLSVLGFSLASALVGVPLARAVALEAAGAPVGWRACYRAGGRTWATVVGAWAVLVPVRLLAGVMLSFPVVAVAALFLPLSAVIALEGGGVGRSLRRSWTIGAASFGRGLGVVVAQQVTTLFLLATIGFVPVIVAFAAPDGWRRVSLNLLQLVAGVFALPPAAWTAATFYLDARIRREGLDLDRRLAEWEASDDGERP